MIKLVAKFLLSLLIVSLTYSQTFKVVESTPDHIKINFNYPANAQIKNKVIDGNKFSYIDTKEYSYKKPGEPWLPSETFLIGIPFNSKLNIKITGAVTENVSNVSILPFPDSANQTFNTLNYDQHIYNSNKKYPESIVSYNTAEMRYAKIASFEISPYQYNPVTRELTYNKKFTVDISFERISTQTNTLSKVDDAYTDDFISSSVLNPNEAKNFIAKSIDNTTKVSADTFWYSPSKDFYKIYLKEKGLYRVSFEKLVAAGVPASELAAGKLELFNLGKKVPIEIVDNDSNGIFNAGDYFNFIGTPPPPHDQYTHLNIYNFSNIYWFSYQSDSTHAYKSIDGYPTNFNNIIRYSFKTIHYEEDKIYERLGHAPDDKRDYWFWGKATAMGGAPYENFLYWMNDSIFYYIYPSLPQATIRVGLQGITDYTCTSSSGHHAVIKLNTNIIGDLYFNGQNSAESSNSFTFSVDGGAGIPLYENNKFEIEMKGDVCSESGDDEVRVNWFDIDFFRWNIIKDKKITFTSPPQNTGKNTYGFFGWYSDNAKIYIPSRGEIIKNPWIKNDADKQILFADSVETATEYFMYDNTSFNEPDSIKKDQSSDLHNIAQGADYIIITHPNFKSVAEKLAAFRSNHLPDISNPRIKIVDVYDIYDEFSGGLLDPYALKSFVKYAFDNWQSPAPTYVVLLGDMSYDYRPIYQWPGNRPNFIPSIPYHAFTFGQAPSDNLIVDIAGDDDIPDIAIGRLSCETVDEGNILVDKMINYPSDNGKDWKQNVLLMASGIDANDELDFGFNDRSMDLENNYLLPNGIHASKVFRFPDKPEYEPFQGGGPKIREEFNKGAVLANYYGHGGGGQWDLTFTNDDIYQLNNQGRLPFVLSVTCYTAHFDDQTIFGEIFNRIPGRGSIAFYGSSGLTWWQAGTYINELFFDQVFNKKNYTIGKAILQSKVTAAKNSYIISQITLLHLLGDPAFELALPKTPDFVIKSNDITFSPQNPIKGDTVTFNVNLKNLGIMFQNPVSVIAYNTNKDSANILFNQKIDPFGENTSFSFKWKTDKAGLFNIIVAVNDDELIAESDHSDNKAIANVPVFDFSEPSVVKPLNGSVQKGKFNFVVDDIGDIIGRKLKYKIIIDTAESLNSPAVINSPILTPVNGFISWECPQLTQNEYYWRTYIFDAADTNKSKIFSLTISPDYDNGYLAANKLLRNLENYNMIYDENSKSLQVNADLISPRPSQSQFIDSLRIALPTDTSALTGITSDGSYYYFTNIPPYINNNPVDIYKVGTGYDGTIRGKIEGPFPYKYPISNSLFYYKDGYIYAPLTDDSTSLLKIDRVTGDTSRVTLGAGLIPSLDGLLKGTSSYYVNSDGKYVYNLSAGYINHRQQYILRKFDPENNWNKVGDDIVFGSSPDGFSGFFVTGKILYTYESRNSGYMRSYNLSDNSFQEEWVLYTPYELYTFTYDWVKNFIIGSTFKPLGIPYTPSFYRFKGLYKDSKAQLFSSIIGPAAKWKNLNFRIDSTGSFGKYNAFLLGLNKTGNSWDTLKTSLASSTSLSELDSYKYPFIKFGMNMVDSTMGISEPLKLKSIYIGYDGSPELSLKKNNIVFAPDTLMQGFNTDLSVQVYNLGGTDADSVTLKYYENDSDSAFIVNSKVKIPKDSSVVIKSTINTSNWAPATLYDTKILAETHYTEQYYFNNIAHNSFYISRDSLNPTFKITFDDKEISNDEIISARPKVVITLQDNSPLPIDTTMFTLVLDGTQLYFSQPDIKFSTTSYPNTGAKIEWNPILKDGKHALDILAKDASGNFFDTVSHRTEFYVFNETDLKNVFNYPNPFKTDTYFTFELHGSQIPDEFNIKVYTVAGRLIKDINVTPSILRVGFNKLYWDGKDQDGDEVANGVYFYKIVSKTGGVVKTATEKLAKVK